MSEPSWLNDTTAKAASAAAKNPHVQAAAKDHVRAELGLPADSGEILPKGQLVDMTEEEYADMKKWHFYLQIAYMLTGLMMSITGALVISNADAQVSSRQLQQQQNSFYFCFIFFNLFNFYTHIYIYIYNDSSFCFLVIKTIHRFFLTYFFFLSSS
jgi:hypothetical protein